MIVSSDNFTYTPETKILSAEISSLGPNFRFERVFPDSADAGLEFYNTKRGTNTKWYINEVEYDRDNDVVAWHLRAVRSDLNDFELVIFND